MSNLENVFRPDVENISKPADIVVIGGGMLGPSVGFFAQQKLGSRGLVVVVEQNEALGMGSSRASLEQGRLSWPDEDVYKMMALSLKFFQQPQKFGVNATADNLGFRKRPYLWLAADDKEIRAYQNLAGILQQRGVNAEYLDQPALRKTWPWLAETSVLGGMLDHSAFKVSSTDLAEVFAKAAGKTDFFVDTTAIAIVVQSGRVVGVKTTRGFIPTAKVIVAAGAGTRRLVETVDGLSVPVVAVPRFSYASSGRDAQLSPDDPFIIVPKTYAYWRPEGDGIFGGFLHEATSVAKPEKDTPIVDWRYKNRFLTALWQGLNPDGLDDYTQAERDTLGLLTSIEAPNGPYSRGNILAGYYVHREGNPGDDRPMITTLSELGMPDIGVVTAEQGHGVMGAPSSGIYGAEIIINGSADVKYDPFKIQPPVSERMSLTI